MYDEVADRFYKGGGTDDNHANVCTNNLSGKAFYTKTYKTKKVRQYSSQCYHVPNFFFLKIQKLTKLGPKLIFGTLKSKLIRPEVILH